MLDAGLKIEKTPYSIQHPEASIQYLFII